MAGNVWEWTLSQWGEDEAKPRFRYPYQPGDGREDLKAGDEVLRVLRGGSFYDYLNVARCACRNRHYPYARNDVIGCRVAVSLIGS
jgi:iron(II)-dependent oxidoreductase